MFPGAARPGEKIGTELDLLLHPAGKGAEPGLNGRRLFDVSPHVLRQRMIKEDNEIRSIRKACAAFMRGTWRRLPHCVRA